jgi:peptidoglycan/xylan/chitin deacetylase (PgdA/CDA1 family)
MVGAGMEVGSHTLTHPSPSSLGRDELRHELAESKRVLEEGLGVAVDFVASPTGYDSRHFAELARDVGYKAALQGVIGRNRRSTDLFALRRFVLKRSHGFEAFARLVDPARRAYRGLRLRQAARNAVRRIVGARGYETIRGLLLGAGNGKARD